MSSPSLCSRCNQRPIAVESGSGMCGDCLVETGRSPATPQSPAPGVVPVADPPTDTFNTLDRLAADLRDSVLDEVHEAARTRDFVSPAEVGTREAPGGAVPQEPWSIAAPGAPVAAVALDELHVPHLNVPASYRLIKKLGRGGMGEVYLARDEARCRLVAMKFLDAAHRAEAKVRFRNELRTLSELKHPNIVTFDQHNIDHTPPFFTMEYVEGGTLADLVTEGRVLDPRRAAQHVLTAARAMSFVHAQRIVHRDIKPSNILLANDGTLKVSDFGLVKRLDEEGMTATQAALGTPEFMPPEQVTRDHGEIDARTDVYGLGATLYYLLTGRPPIQAPGPPSRARTLATLTLIPREEPTRVRALRHDVPMALEAIVDRCLRKRPEHRYQSAAELAADLELFLTEGKARTKPITPVRRLVRWIGRNRVRIAAVMAATALAITTAAAFYRLSPVQVDSEAEFVAEGRRSLLEGKQLQLIGRTGSPVYSRWRLGPGETRANAGEDGAFAIVARGYGFLELFPDPGINSYTFAAEIQHLEAAGAINVPPVPALHTVGLYVAHDQYPGNDESRIHTFGVVTFSDFLPKDARFAELFYRDLALHERRLQATVARPFPVDSARRTPAGFPGPWRRFEITVTPSEVTVSDGLRFAVQDATALQARTKNLQAWADQAAPGVKLGTWSPRRPLGIWVYGSCVAVRNVTIIPHSPNQK